MPRVRSCEKDAKKRSERRSQVGKSPARDFLVPSAFNYKKVGRKGEKNGERSELTIPRLVLLAIFFFFCCTPFFAFSPMLSLVPGYHPPSRQPIDTSWNIAWQYLPCTMYTALYTDLSKINIVFWPHFITLYSYFIVSGKYQFGKILSNSHIHICVHVKSKLHWNCRTFSSDPFHVTTRHNMLAEVALGHGLNHVKSPPAPLTLST